MTTSAEINRQISYIFPTELLHGKFCIYQYISGISGLVSSHAKQPVVHSTTSQQTTESDSINCVQ